MVLENKYIPLKQPQATKKKKSEVDKTETCGIFPCLTNNRAQGPSGQTSSHEQQHLLGQPRQRMWQRVG